MKGERLREGTRMGKRENQYVSCAGKLPCDGLDRYVYLKYTDKLNNKKKIHDIHLLHPSRLEPLCSGLDLGSTSRSRQPVR